jgi:hypothetical protein
MYIVGNYFPNPIESSRHSLTRHLRGGKLNWTAHDIYDREDQFWPINPVVNICRSTQNFVYAICFCLFNEAQKSSSILRVFEMSSKIIYTLT